VISHYKSSKKKVKLCTENVKQLKWQKKLPIRQCNSFDGISPIINFLFGFKYGPEGTSPKALDRIKFFPNKGDMLAGLILIYKSRTIRINCAPYRYWETKETSCSSLLWVEMAEELERVRTRSWLTGVSASKVISLEVELRSGGAGSASCWISHKLTMSLIWPNQHQHYVAARLFAVRSNNYFSRITTMHKLTRSLFGCRNKFNWLIISAMVRLRVK